MRSYIAYGLSSLAMATFTVEAQEISQADLNQSYTQAVRQGDVRALAALQELGANPQARDRNGDNAVLMAVIGRQDALLRTLLDRGVDTDVVGSSGLTPLTAATINSDLRSVRALIKAGARVDLRNRNGDSPLHLAISLGRHEILRELLDAGAEPGRHNGEGETPLIQSIRAHDLVTFNALLQRGVDVSQADTGGRSPLFWTIFEDQESMAIELTQRHARSYPRADGFTPLQLANAMGHQRLAALIEGR